MLNRAGAAERSDMMQFVSSVILVATSLFVLLNLPACSLLGSAHSAGTPTPSLMGYRETATPTATASQPTVDVTPAATATMFPTPAPTATQRPPATATPTIPVFQPTPTGTPSPHLSVAPSGPLSVVCYKALLATLTVTNTGVAPLSWAASATTGSNVTVTPHSGTLDVGQSQSVTIGGPSSQSAFSVAFTSNGGSQTVQFSCS